MRKGNIKVKGEIRKQGRKKGDVNKALNGDTGKPEDDQLTEGGGGVESQRSSSGEVEASAGSPWGITAGEGEREACFSREVMKEEEEEVTAATL